MGRKSEPLRQWRGDPGHGRSRDHGRDSPSRDPLRRAVGSKDPFALEPTSLPAVPDAPKRPPADRSKLDAAEKALGVLDEARKREEAAIRREAEDLEARRMASQAAYVEARKTATAAVVDARTAYRRAGGD